MTDERKAAIKERAADWLLQQGVSTVLLVAILVSIGYGFRYAMTTAIPQHIETLRGMVRDVEASHREERETRDKKFLEDHERDRQLIREFIFNSKTKPVEN